MLALADLFDCFLISLLHFLQGLQLTVFLLFKLQNGLGSELVHIALRDACTRELAEEELVRVKQTIAEKGLAWVIV